MLERTRVAITTGIRAGHHQAAQVSARSGGNHYQLAVGEATPGVAMTDATLMAWFSACKPVLAIATCQLVDRGLLHLDTPINHVIPEFVDAVADAERRAWKRQVTVRHLLTHTAGFRVVSGVHAGAAWDKQIAAICATSLEPGWHPGQKAGYHERTGWTLLGEVVARSTGDGNVRSLLERAVLRGAEADAARYGLPLEHAWERIAAPPMVTSRSPASMHPGRHPYGSVIRE
jgi:CubicO group peptidase (beta-lactamase class C family)